MKQYLSFLKVTFAIGITSLLMTGLTGIALQAQAPSTPDATSEGVEALIAWNKPEKFDTGMQSQAAINSSGMVVEIHRSESNYKSWYHVGRLTQYGQSVNWGKSHAIEVAGRSPRDKQVFPTVALTNDNYVIIEYSDGIDKVGSELHYRVGRISPSGSVDQDIEWLTADTIYDTGYDSSLSVNGKGVIVEVHESDGKTGIFYRIGHLEDPSAGKYSIVWDSGDLGIQYDNGVIPHISINNQNQVVEMHQINSKESIVHYRRGTLQFKSGSPARIVFEASQRYRENAREPAVLLTDRDSVVALYQNGNIFWETGVYHTYNPAYIWWQGNVKMRDNALGRYPGIGSNDVYMIATWHLDGKLYYATAFVP
jgi:hypothetical protein